MKISFDYDGTFSTSKGKDLAKSLADTNTIYIISARDSKEGIKGDFVPTVLRLGGRFNAAKPLL